MTKRREEELDDKEAAANERDTKDLEDAAKGKEAPKEDPDEFEVKGEDDDEPDDDDDEPERPSRKERRRQRGQNRVREAEERAARAAEDAAADRALMAQMIQQNRQVLERLAPQRTEEDPRKQLEEQFSGLEDQRQALVSEYEQLKAAGKMDAATHAQFVTKDRGLRLKIAEVQHRMFAPPPQPQITPQQFQAATTLQRLRMDHGDVVGTPAGQFYFRGAYNQLLAQGAPDAWDTIEKAAAKARTLLGLPPKGGRPAPSRGERAKFEGAPRGGGSGGAERSTVRMTKEMKKMADAMYGDTIKDERKRYQKFANEFGNDPDFRS